MENIPEWDWFENSVLAFSPLPPPRPIWLWIQLFIQNGENSALQQQFI